MMTKSFFLQDIGNYKHWIIIAIIAKLLFFSFMLSENLLYTEENGIYLTCGDTWMYTSPIDNLIENRGYFPDFRMPGYGIIYFLFRLIFSKVMALNLVVITQVLLSAISVYLLALIVKDIFNSVTLFYVSFYAYLFSTYVSIYDIWIQSDSPAIACSIFSLYCFVRGIKKVSYISLFLSGLFLTWCVFIRPVYSPLFVFFGFTLMVIYIRKKFSYSRIFKSIFLFILVFVLIDGAWMVRNYKIYKYIIPLQRFVEPATEEPRFKNDKLAMSLFEFLESWGGDRLWWNPKADINWFEYIDIADNIKRQVRDIQFPTYIYTSKFNYSDLEIVKHYIACSKDESLPRDEREKYSRLATERLNDFTTSIKREKPYVYYVLAPLLRLKKFLFHSGTYNLFRRPYTELNFVELIFKISMSLIYLFVVIGGFLGIIVLSFNNYKINLKLLLAVMAAYFVLIMPFIFKFFHYRHFLPAYPFMLVCAIYFTYTVYNTVFKHRLLLI